MSSSFVGTTDCILLVKNIPQSFAEGNLRARCESMGHSCIILHSQGEAGGCYTVKLLAPSPEAARKISTMIDGMRCDQTWISTEVRPWTSLNTLERNQYPANVLLDPGMLESLRLSLTQSEKIQDLHRQNADLQVELAGYQMSSGTSGSKEMIQVFKLGNEFLRAAKSVTPTTYGATPDLLNNITTLRDIMSKPDSPPTVPQITSALSACFVPLFQHLSSTYQTNLATHQELEMTMDELATVKAANEGLRQRVGQYSSDHLLHTPLTESTDNLKAEIEALKKQSSGDQARLTVLTVVSQENKKLRTQNAELKGKVESFRERIRLSEERHSTSANGESTSIEPPDVPMVDSTSLSRERDMETRFLECEKEHLTRSLEGEKNMRLGVEMELADLKVEYEQQEKMMIDWFLEAVRVSNGEEYLKQLKTLKEIRPMPPSKSRDSFYRLLG